VIRNGSVIQDDLKVHSFKNLKDDITHADKGIEAGIAFENFMHHPFQINDVIECY
jgi:translation initiation factor IF-2